MKTPPHAPNCPSIQDAHHEYIHRTGDTYPVRPERFFAHRRYSKADKVWLEACKDWNLRFLRYYHKSVMRKVGEKEA